MRNVIWCEVSCGCCGSVANESGYYSPERIRLLKAETKDWVDDVDYRVLCPACSKKMKRTKT